jgi:hypothetical protein
MENNIKTPEEIAVAIQEANKYFDANPPKAHTQKELDEFFKRVSSVKDNTK